MLFSEEYCFDVVHVSTHTYYNFLPMSTNGLSNKGKTILY